MNNSLSQKLTILIPTYNRHKELKKKIKYLMNYNFKVLIIDGSPRPLKTKFIGKAKNIRYFHFPVENRYDRIFFAIKKIKTKYVKLEADNDYYPPSSLNKSVDYLEEKNNYSAVIGKCGIYSEYKKKIYIKELFKSHKSLNQNNLFSRFSNYMENYSPAIYHSVLRSNIFKKQNKLLKKSKKIYGDKFDVMAEFCSTFICCAYGKVKKLDYMTWIRADDDITLRKDFIGIKKLLGNSINQKEYQNKNLKLLKTGYLDDFFKLLTTEIPNRNKKINYKIQIKKIYEDALNLSIKRKKQSKRELKYFLKKVFMIIIPSGVKKFLRFHLKINGPSLKELIESKIKVDYKFYKIEFIEINKYLLSD